VATGVLVGVVVRRCSGCGRKRAPAVVDRGAVGRRCRRAARRHLGRVQVPAPVDAPELAVARADADEAFRQYLAERGAKRVANDQWAQLFGIGTALRVAADSLDRLASIGLRADRPAAAEGTGAPGAVGAPEVNPARDLAAA
jgi:hypothetical protein